MELRIREKILHIMNMALSLNAKDGVHVFVRFYGHANTLTVKVYKHGWNWTPETGSPVPNLDVTAYLDCYDSVAELDTVFDYLESMQKEVHQKEMKQNVCT